MNPKRLALLSLVILALCWSSLALPRETAARRAGAVPTLSWSELLSSRPLAVAAIGGEDALVAGTFADSLVIGGDRFTARSASDIWVSRTDARGHPLWTKQFSAGGHLSSMAAGADHLVLAGESDSGIDFGGGALAAGVFLAKLDGSGNHVWSKVIAGAHDVHRVRVDGEGAVIALFATHGPIDPGAGPIASASGKLVTKLDARGRHVWSKTYGSGATMLDIAVTRDGDVIVGGKLRGAFDFGGGPIADAGGGDAFLVRYDPDGRHRWSRRSGDPDDKQDARDLAVDDAGNLFVEQAEESGPTLGLYKYDPRGEPLWSKWLGANTVVAMATDHAGNVAYATANLTTGEDDSIELLDGEGRPVWSRTLGHDSGSFAGLAFSGSGVLLVTGRVSSTIDLWGTIVNPTPETMGFLAALALDPVPIRSPTASPRRLYPRRSRPGVGAA
ncbi:hypothetical protein [Sorangium sp. So ce1335]|uniref:hypothetical protein n=1 Tax=Sorangium sp. So ce1335 TaxID=3133335 RepID=UPI003F5FD569